MKRDDLIRSIEQGESVLVRHGGKHDWYRKDRMFAALQFSGWRVKRQSGSHKTLARDGYRGTLRAVHQEPNPAVPLLKCQRGDP
jgi:predicted RNA binding protein YcfA (HicA-like mRNA interferase family)